jgi:predicted phage terminase large subunit-like protein
MYDSILLHALLRSDFMIFLEKVFSELEGKEITKNWHLEAISYQLEQCYEGENTRLLINLPPRTAKSIIISVAYSLFVLGNTPSTKIIAVSHTQDLAENFNNMCRRIIKTNWFKGVFPECKLSSMKNSASEITTTMGGYRLAISIGGALTGRGADLIILDDINKGIDGESAARRDSAKQWFDNTLQTRLNNLNTGVIIAVQQRLHTDDLTGHLLEKGDIWKNNHLVLPAIATETLNIPIGNGITHTFNKGDYLFPAMLGADALKAQKESMGTPNFSAQYQQSPIPATGNIIPIDKFKRYTNPPKFRDGDIIINSWDTATKTGPKNDYTVGTIWLYRFNAYYLLNVIRGKLLYPKMKKEVLLAAQGSNADYVLIEDTNLGSCLIQDLTVETKLNIKPVIPRIDKISRMEACTASIETGKVSIPQEAPWLEDFLKECAGFPDAVTHDDQVDSISQFLNWAREFNGIFEAKANLNDALDELAEPDEPDDYDSKEGLKLIFLKNFKPEGDY